MKVKVSIKNEFKITLAVWLLFLCAAAFSLLITGKKLYRVVAADAIYIDNSAVGILGAEFLLAWNFWLFLLNRKKCVFETYSKKFYVYDTKESKGSHIPLENIYEVSLHKKENMIKIFYTKNYLKDFKIRFDELFFYDRNAYFMEYDKEIKTANLYLTELPSNEINTIYSYFRDNIPETVDFDKEVSVLCYALRKIINDGEK